MTLLFMDGFDSQDFATKWLASPTLVPDWATHPTRFGTGYAISASNPTGSSLLTLPVTASAKLITGFAFRMNNTNAASILSYFADAGAVEHIRINMNANGSIAITRVGTVLATSAVGVVPLNTWVYIEVSGTVNDTTGAVDVKVNGVSVVTFTGDTKNAGTSVNMDQIRIDVNNSSRYGYDDLYVCNDQGSRNNAFLGDVRVQTLRPNGAGSAAAMTPVGSGSNYANVDEATPNPADFNYSGTPGHQDLYAMEDLAAGTAAVLAVQVNNAARKTDSGARSIKNLIRAGGTTTASAVLALSVTSDVYSTVHDGNPTTATAWDVADIAALEAGVEVV